MADILEINPQYDGSYLPKQLKKIEDSNIKIVDNVKGIFLEKIINSTTGITYEVSLKDALVRNNFASCFINILQSLNQGNEAQGTFSKDEETYGNILKVYLSNIWLPKFGGGDISKDVSYLEINDTWAFAFGIYLKSEYGFAKNLNGYTTQCSDDEGYLDKVELVLDRSEDSDILEKLYFKEINKNNWINKYDYIEVSDYFYDLLKIFIQRNNNKEYYPVYAAQVTLDRNVKTDGTIIEGEKGAGYNIKAFRSRNFENSYLKATMKKKFEKIEINQETGLEEIIPYFEEFVYKIPIEINIENKLIWPLVDSNLLVQESNYIYKATASWATIQASESWVNLVNSSNSSMNYCDAYGDASEDFVDKQSDNISGLDEKLDDQYKVVFDKIKKMADDANAKSVFDISLYNSTSGTYDTFPYLPYYDSLSVALSNVPGTVQKGYMSIEFLFRTSTPTGYRYYYLKYKLDYKNWTTTTSYWKLVSDEALNAYQDFFESYTIYRDKIKEFNTKYESLLQCQTNIEGYNNDIKTYKNQLNTAIQNHSISDVNSATSGASAKKNAINTKQQSAKEDYNKCIEIYKEIIFSCLTNSKFTAQEVVKAVNDTLKDEALEEIKRSALIVNENYVRQGFNIADAGTIYNNPRWNVTKYYQIPSDVDFLCWDCPDPSPLTYIRFSEKDEDDISDADLNPIQDYWVLKNPGANNKINITAIKDRLKYFCFDWPTDKQSIYLEQTRVWFEKAPDPDMVELTYEMKNLEQNDLSAEDYDNSLEQLELDFKAPEEPEPQVLEYNWSVGFQVWCPNLNLLSYNLLPIDLNVNFIDKNLGEESGDKNFGLFKYIELRAKFTEKLSSDALFIFAFQYVDGAESDEENFGIRLHMTN